MMNEENYGNSLARNDVREMEYTLAEERMADEVDYRLRPNPYISQVVEAAHALRAALKTDKGEGTPEFENQKRQYALLARSAVDAHERNEAYLNAKNLNMFRKISSRFLTESGNKMLDIREAPTSPVPPTPGKFLYTPEEQADLQEFARSMQNEDSLESRFGEKYTLEDGAAPNEARRIASQGLPDKEISNAQKSLEYIYNRDSIGLGSKTRIEVRRVSENGVPTSRLVWRFADENKTDEEKKWRTWNPDGVDVGDIYSALEPLGELTTGVIGGATLAYLTSALSSGGRPVVRAALQLAMLSGGEGIATGMYNLVRYRKGQEKGLEMTDEEIWEAAVNSGEWAAGTTIALGGLAWFARKIFGKLPKGVKNQLKPQDYEMIEKLSQIEGDDAADLTVAQVMKINAEKFGFDSAEVDDLVSRLFSVEDSIIMNASKASTPMRLKHIEQARELVRNVDPLIPDSTIMDPTDVGKIAQGKIGAEARAVKEEMELFAQEARNLMDNAVDEISVISKQADSAAEGRSISETVQNMRDGLAETKKKLFDAMDQKYKRYWPEFDQFTGVANSTREAGEKINKELGQRVYGSLEMNNYHVLGDATRNPYNRTEGQWQLGEETFRWENGKFQKFWPNSKRPDPKTGGHGWQNANPKDHPHVMRQFSVRDMTRDIAALNAEIRQRSIALNMSDRRAATLSTAEGADVRTLLELRDAMRKDRNNAIYAFHKAKYPDDPNKARSEAFKALQEAIRLDAENAKLHQDWQRGIFGQIVSPKRNGKGYEMTNEAVIPLLMRDSQSAMFFLEEATRVENNSAKALEDVRDIIWKEYKRATGIDDQAGKGPEVFNHETLNNWLENRPGIKILLKEKDYETLKKPLIAKKKYKEKEERRKQIGEKLKTTFGADINELNPEDIIPKMWSEMSIADHKRAIKIVKEDPDLWKVFRTSYINSVLREEKVMNGWFTQKAHFDVGKLMDLAHNTTRREHQKFKEVFGEEYVNNIKKLEVQWRRYERAAGGPFSELAVRGVPSGSQGGMARSGLTGTDSTVHFARVLFPPLSRRGLMLTAGLKEMKDKNQAATAKILANPELFNRIMKARNSWQTDNFASLYASEFGIQPLGDLLHYKETANQGIDETVDFGKRVGKSAIKVGESAWDMLP